MRRVSLVAVVIAGAAWGGDRPMQWPIFFSRAWCVAREGVAGCCCVSFSAAQRRLDIRRVFPHLIFGGVRLRGSFLEPGHFRSAREALRSSSPRLAVWHRALERGALRATMENEGRPAEIHKFRAGGALAPPAPVVISCATSCAARFPSRHLPARTRGGRCDRIRRCQGQ